MKKPMFSILLPAMGRPRLVREALLSVLLQDFKDVEVIVSNNGADSKIKESISDLLNDPRIHYIEWPDPLSMPVHWEQISKMAVGRYVTVLTDRSVLKQGALSEIAKIHSQEGEATSVISWGWDLYYDDMRLLSPNAENAKAPVILDAGDVMIDSLNVSADHPYALPRGLNSSVSNEFIARIREKAGSAFSSLCPDFTFAYACLHNCSNFTYFNKSLMVSQGLKVSNGGNAYKTDASAYVKTLSLTDPIFKNSPIKGCFVENLIFEDFLASCYLFNNLNILNSADIADTFVKCFNELREKRISGVLPRNHLEELSKSLDVALKKQSLDVRSRVSSKLRQSTSLPIKARQILRYIVGRYIGRLKPLYLKLKGGKIYSSALEAAGYENL